MARAVSGSRKGPEGQLNPPESNARAPSKGKGMNGKAIIKRIEQVRKEKNFNKRGFSQAIGLTPQTYNNFTGKRASKPSLTLVCGVIKKFKIDPNWILFGKTAGGPANP